MQGKGLEADRLVYATLAYSQLTAATGKLAAASDTLNEMAKNTPNKFWFMPSKRA
jgi:hypothetical protein